MSNPDFSRSKCQKEGKTSTKIVVRRLPPNFTLELFREQVSPLSEYNYLYFVSADTADGANSFSRVYINFVHPEDMYIFKEKYDGYVFLGPRGAEYPAVVEFAPFQKVPKDLLFQRRDVKSGTIQLNEYYVQFLNNLKLSKSEAVERPEYDLHLKSHLNEHEGITPLVKYVSAKKSEQIRNRADRKREMKQQKHENCMIFINSSVKRAGQRLYLKRHSQ